MYAKTIARPNAQYALCSMENVKECVLPPQYTTVGHYAIPQCNRSLVTNEEEMADPTPPERRCRKRRKKDIKKSKKVK